MSGYSSACTHAQSLTHRLRVYGSSNIPLFKSHHTHTGINEQIPGGQWDLAAAPFLPEASLVKQAREPDSVGGQGHSLAKLKSEEGCCSYRGEFPQG